MGNALSSETNDASKNVGRAPAVTETKRRRHNLPLGGAPSQPEDWPFIQVKLHQTAVGVAIQQPPKKQTSTFYFKKQDQIYIVLTNNISTITL